MAAITTNVMLLKHLHIQLNVLFPEPVRFQGDCLLLNSVSLSVSIMSLEAL